MELCYFKWNNFGNVCSLARVTQIIFNMICIIERLNNKEFKSTFFLEAQQIV